MDLFDLCCNRSAVKLAKILYFAFLYPLDVGLSQGGRKHILTTYPGINRDILFHIYNEAWVTAYTVEIIKAAFKVTGIIP